MSETEHTTAYKLFHYYFQCEIPESYAIENRIQMEGMPIYNKNSDLSEQARMMVRRQHTPIEMLEYHRRGASIVICDPKDAVTIYSWFHDYLTSRRNNMQYKINIGNIPIEDLTLMDEFAGVLYRIARNYESANSLDLGLAEMKAQKLLGRRLLRSRKMVPDAPVAEEVKVREHRPITDEISRDIIERNISYTRRKD